MARASRTKGFSMIELIVVIAIIMIMAAAAVLMMGPTLQNYRLTGDARSIASSLALARMRAAAQFTRAEVCFDFTGGNCSPTSAPNTYQVEVWNKATPTCCFVPEAGTAPQALSQGNIFVPACPNPGCFPVGMPPLGGQATLQQGTGSGAAPVGFAQIVFNSRGIALDPAFLPASVPVATDVIYIVNPQINFYCGTTASIAGQQTVWKYTSNAWFQM
ncbi:MAG TPA: prepilin-type N-terminal cleavage/methylation domain-containing protein [Terriglobia bacterium]|nr:prepilin-type N-terminal cleavage/methylation domain-containing protein [Terriglobia bacterium]